MSQQVLSLAVCLALIAFIGNAALAQQSKTAPSPNARDLLLDVDQRLKTLEKLEERLSQPRSTDAEVQAISETAKMVMDSSRRVPRRLPPQSMRASTRLTGIRSSLRTLLRRCRYVGGP